MPRDRAGIFCMDLLDEKYMRMALNLAEKGEGKTSPNPLVGAVVVKNRKIVGQGYHRAFGLPHAEVNALRDAGTKTRGATLYINLEPCCYFGKTPPCTDAIAKAGIKRVVCAIFDPNPRVRGKGAKKLKEKGIKVDMGILKKEALRLNEIYLKFIKTKLPFLILNLTQTLDGKMINHSGDYQNLFPGKTKSILKNLKSRVDAVLTQNNLYIYSKSEIGSARKWKMDNGTRGLISLIKKAGKNNITSILIDGGKENFTHLLKNELVDKIYYSISTQIWSEGTEPFGDLGISKISNSIHLKNPEINRFADSKNASHSILIVGYPVRRKQKKD